MVSRHNAGTSIKARSILGMGLTWWVVVVVAHDDACWWWCRVRNKKIQKWSVDAV